MSAVNPDPSVMPVADAVCDRCLLGSRPLVDAARRAEILQECAETGRAFVCHRGTMTDSYIVCRAFYERGLSLSARLARAFGAVRFVPTPEGETR